MKPHQWRRSGVGKYLRHLPRIKHIRGTWLHRRLGDRLFASELWRPDRKRFAWGMVVGVFFALMPMPFLQMLSAGIVAYLMRVSVPVALAATWISNPLTTPFIFYGQYLLGSLLMGRHFRVESARDFLDLIKQAPVPLAVGAILTGVVLALASYPASLAVWDSFTNRMHRRAAKNSEGKS